VVEEAIVEVLRQSGSGVRLDWGLAGARVQAERGGALVVVDTLSFTTAVSVATSRGIGVLPWPLADDGAAELASLHDAALAVPRRLLSASRPWSLSPRSLLEAPFTPRLVLPSPNGSAIAASFLPVADAAGREPSGDAPVRVLAGCLRNAAATAGWLLGHGYGSRERPVAVVAAGERWPDGALRPAFEDLLGAGAIVAALEEAAPDLAAARSVEAIAAASTFLEFRGAGLVSALERCASGRELEATGFSGEAEIAAALDADAHASVLEGVAFAGV
jgi:2-phosphosulfolactate phosphatase